MRIRILAFFAALVLPMTLLANPVTYYYNGQDFTYLATAGGEPQVYTDNDRVSGEFTLSAPLADNMPLTSISPTSFSFSDDVQTISNLSSNFSFEVFEVETNATGAIVEWDIFLQTTNNGASNTVETYDSGGFAEDVGDVDAVSIGPAQFYAEGLNITDNGSTSAGTWFANPPPLPTAPEPPGLMLLATGLLGATALRRHRRRHPEIPSLALPTES
jgi:hypothetical protein